MAGSLEEKEYNVILTIKTARFHEELEELILEQLEEVGLDVTNVNVTWGQ